MSIGDRSNALERGTGSDFGTVYAWFRCRGKEKASNSQRENPDMTKGKCGLLLRWQRCYVARSAGRPAQRRSTSRRANCEPRRRNPDSISQTVDGVTITAPRRSRPRCKAARGLSYSPFPTERGPMVYKCSARHLGGGSNKSAWDCYPSRCPDQRKRERHRQRGDYTGLRQSQLGDSVRRRAASSAHLRDCPLLVQLASGRILGIGHARLELRASPLGWRNGFMSTQTEPGLPSAFAGYTFLNEIPHNPGPPIHRRVVRRRWH